MWGLETVLHRLLGSLGTTAVMFRVQTNETEAETLNKKLGCSSGARKQETSDLTVIFQEEHPMFILR